MLPTRTRRPGAVLVGASERVDPIALPRGARNLAVTSADGTRLHVEIHGPDDAPTIVLAHGFSQATRTWAYQVADLADRHRVVVYDQRGHGRSGWAHPAAYTIDALGDDLQAVLEAVLRPGERAVVGGHSMGGITIMAWARRYPAAVERRAAAVVLVNTAASRIAEHLALIGLPRSTHGPVDFLVRQRLLAIVHARARPLIRLLAMGDTADRVHMDAVMQMLSTTPAPTLRRFMAALFAMDETASLAALTVPAVVIGGERDRLLPAAHNHLLARRLPELAQHRMLPGSGHMSPWEARAEVSGLLADTAGRYLAVPSASA